MIPNLRAPVKDGIASVRSDVAEEGAQLGAGDRLRDDLGEEAHVVGGAHVHVRRDGHDGDFREAAIREMHEETGLTFEPLEVDPMYEEPRFTTVGLTDESCATVYGYTDGEISDRFMEDTENIEIVLADRDEVRRILKEEKVAIMCAYQLMHFLVDDDPFAFLIN